MHAADSEKPHWLYWFIGKSGERYGSVPHPFRLPNGMRAASCGLMVMVAVTTEDGYAAEDKSGYPKAVMELLSLPIEKSVGLTRQKATALFGECVHPATISCRECKGNGKVSHKCNCGFCEVTTEKCGTCNGGGLLSDPPPYRLIAVWGVAFNANLVAYALEHMPRSESYKFSLAINGGKSRQLELLRIETKAGIVAMASMSTTRETVEVFDKKKGRK